MTDIPWKEGWLRHVPEFAKWCATVLKPEGVLVTWYGQLYLDRLLAGLSRHLHYQWMFVSPFYGSSRFESKNITVRYRPAVVFSVGEKLRLHRETDDWCPASRRVKHLHKHQQPLPPTQYLVEAFSEDGNVICDRVPGRSRPPRLAGTPTGDSSAATTTLRASKWHARGSKFSTSNTEAGASWTSTSTILDNFNRCADG